MRRTGFLRIDSPDHPTAAFLHTLGPKRTLFSSDALDDDPLTTAYDHAVAPPAALIAAAMASSMVANGSIPSLFLSIALASAAPVPCTLK